MVPILRMTIMRSRTVQLAVYCLLLTDALGAQTSSRITTPKDALGFTLGDDYRVATYRQLEAYGKKLASKPGRMKLQPMGASEEAPRQYMASMSSPANLAR